MPLSKLQQALKAQQSQEAYNAARKKSSLNKSAKEESLKRSSKEKRVLKKVRQATRVEPVAEAVEHGGDADGMVVINDSNRPTIDLDMEAKPKKTKSKKKQGTNPNQLPVVPFTITDTILLLGEANFSYSLSLIKHHSIPSHQMLATSYDTERECYLKYPDGEANVKALREAGVKVEFKVDAGNLEKCKAVGKGRWSRVIFNFPHAGMSRPLIPSDPADSFRSRNNGPRSKYPNQPTPPPTYSPISSSSPNYRTRIRTSPPTGI
jgi:25S rRNA (uracil2634-N3)-methyltransferase